MSKKKTFYRITSFTFCLAHNIKAIKILDLTFLS